MQAFVAKTYYFNHGSLQRKFLVIRILPAPAQMSGEHKISNHWQQE